MFKKMRQLPFFAEVCSFSLTKNVNDSDADAKSVRAPVMISVGQVVGNKWHQKRDKKTDLAAAEDDAFDSNDAGAQVISGHQLGAKYFGTTGTRFWSQENPADADNFMLMLMLMIIITAHHGRVKSGPVFLFPLGFLLHPPK